MEEIVLSKEGVRFTVTVPAGVAESPTAIELYEHMADTMRKEVQRVQGILAPGREV